jgi:acetyl-CoA carboxylase biotin carboxylase subunit
VAGIKTNLGLFRRILADDEFQSGKIDTGYLERLLKVETGVEGNDAGKSTANIAAIAAAVFAVLDSTSKTTGNGAASNQEGARSSENSSWKKAARTEGLM